MATKSVTKLYNIFIDTGVFIDRLRVDLSTASNDVKKRIEQINMFFELINEIQHKITFQTSSINVAELFHCGNKHKDTAAALVSVCGSNDLEIIAFDADAAAYHNSWLERHLGNATIKEIKAAVNYPVGGNLANVEDRIRKDMLICSVAKMYKADIVLTNDSGFATLCDKLELPVHCFTGDATDFTTSNDGKKIYDFAK